MDDVSLSYLELTQLEPGSEVSRGLQEFCAYYSNQLSYSEVAALVERHCGARVLSSQAIWQLVQKHALSLSDAIERATLHGLSGTPIQVASSIDLYDSASQEVIVLDDAIGVKAQKPQRSRLPSSVDETSTHPATVTPDVVMLQTAPAQFESVSVWCANRGRWVSAITH